MASNLRCAIYTRKSTSEGLEKAFNTLDAQRESCAAYIQCRALEGWTVVDEVFEDGGFTGANTDRPGFQRLLERVGQGLVDAVIVYKVDRLSRSLLDFVQVMSHFTQKGVAFVSVTQNFSTADPVGRLTLNILMSFAEFEREMITERIRDKVGAARRKGRWTGGHAPLGYVAAGGRLVVEEGEAPWVQKVFGWYLEGASAITISDRLNDAGVPLKTSKAGRPRPWTQGLVLRILRNRLYLGELHCRGEYVAAEHPALIDRTTFDAVQARLDPKQRRASVVSRNPSYLMRGTLRCGICGHAMTSASMTRKGRIHRYYRCSTRGRDGKKACPTRQLPAEALERFVVDRMKDILANREVLDRVLATLGMEGLATGFDVLWEGLTLPNRQRLVRTLVQEVEVDQRKGTLRLEMRPLEATPC